MSKLPTTTTPRNSKQDEWEDERGHTPQFAMIFRPDLVHPVVQRLKPTAFRVWVIVSMYVGGRGRTWDMSVDQIAKDAGRDVREVQRAMAELQEVGLVRVTRQHNESGRSNWNKYTLLRAKVGGEIPRGQGGGIPQGQGGGIPHPRQGGESPHPLPEQDKTPKQNTHAADTDTESPAALVSAFHREARNVDTTRALKKELALATELIEAHGFAGAAFISRFAIVKAKKAGFNMATFGAVRVYVGEAAQRLEQARALSKYQERIARIDRTHVPPELLAAIHAESTKRGMPIDLPPAMSPQEVWEWAESFNLPIEDFAPAD